VIAVVLFGRYFTAPILRVMAKTGLREVFTGFALLLVVGTAQLMQSAGVSMALGAFLAGVLLASSEFRHALETDIEPFKGLLMGLFFIAVGMSIDFSLLRASPLLVASLVAAMLALKGLALATLAPALQVSKKQRWLFAALLCQGGEFAFVVFGVAERVRLMPGQWDATLTLVVALSMLCTPLLLLVLDLLDRFTGRGEERPMDTIESEGAPVIIAGFGRFGQIVGRLLFASGIQATVLDQDPDQIELLRKWGFRVFYGDATRSDLLHNAGIEQAKLLVVAIDDPSTSLRIVEHALEHHPGLRIVACARNVGHYLELRRRGVEQIEREMFEGSLRAGRRALELLGVQPYEARELADRFRAHNVRSLEELLPYLADEALRMSMAKAAREQLEAQFARDREARGREMASWTSEELAERDSSSRGAGSRE
jgi:glutathione-regulated potassium-efflux system ancillary protein KefC